MGSFSMVVFKHREMTATKGPIPGLSSISFSLFLGLNLLFPEPHLMEIPGAWASNPLPTSPFSAFQGSALGRHPSLTLHT